MLASASIADPVELADVAPGDVAGIAIDGAAASHYAGFGVGNAGDVNGDGLDDIVVGAFGANYNSDNAGAAFVIFGRPEGASTLALSDVNSGLFGFVIRGEAETDFVGAFVSGAGDVNKDGLADLIIEAGGADPNGDTSGRCYVVFGKTDTSPVELSAVAAGAGGFVINGALPGDGIAMTVSRAGDINRDGFDDLVVGMPNADVNTSFSVGKAYVIFGKSNTNAVELSTIETGTGGFTIDGSDTIEMLGTSVDCAGDINGDGSDDLIVGAYYARTGGELSFFGRAYVVFGKSDGTAVDAADIAAGIGGFAITGEVHAGKTGVEVAGAGDVNGDGRADLLVGAPWHPSGAGGAAGRAYVVFGKSGTAEVLLSAVAAGTGGFAIDGETDGDEIGHALATAEDLNGDGRDDIILGSPTAPGGIKTGKVYFVFGKSNTDLVNLADVSADIGGFALNGEASPNYAGSSVAGIPDFNADGVPELLIGAWGVNESAGRSYLVFGDYPSRRVWVDFTNDGTETGQFATPFNTFGEGITAVPAGGIITVKAGNVLVTASENLTVSKPMTITVVGGTLASATEGDRQHRKCRKLPSESRYASIA